MKKYLILVDLDGVLNNYRGNYNENIIPEIREGAKDFLKELSSNFTVKIFTTRNQKKTQEWIKENSLETYVSGVTNIKEPAFLIIDDRCINFNGDYSKTLEQIKKFKVWHSK